MPSRFRNAALPLETPENPAEGGVVSFDRVSRPTTLGPYELKSSLGSGGMAETFLAVRRGPGQFEQSVCIKRILGAFERDQAFVSQFLEEARVSARLRHANVVQVLDFGVADGSHYLALELVDGMDLAKLLRLLHSRGETLTAGIVSYIAAELANALDYAHGHPSGPVIHRDISPSNVLLSRAGEVKLTDFGIAKAATPSDEAPKTTTGTVKGKVPYMAAEYAMSGKGDHRADLFALGVLLYESLAGRRPYIGQTDLDTLSRICSGVHPPLAQLCPNAPTDLVRTIECLIKPNPEDRFASAAALLDSMVDVAPPPTARRILAELVRNSAKDIERAPRTPEVAIEGTQAITDAARKVRDPEPTPGRPQDPTRTRLPPDVGPTEINDRLPLDPTILGPRADSIPAAIVSAPSDVPETRPRERPRSKPPMPSTPTLTTPDGPPEFHRPASPIDTPPLAFSSPPRERRSLRSFAFAAAAAAGVSAGLALVAWFGFTRSNAPADTTLVSDANPEVAVEARNSPAAIGTSAAAAPTSAPVPPPANPVADAPSLPRAGAATPSAPVIDAPPAITPLAPPSAEVPAQASARPTTGERSRSSRPGSTRTHAETTAAPPAPAEETENTTGESATVHITVAPWGNIWVDGRPMGRAPYTAHLSPGSHRIEAGFERPVETRSVRLRSGERRPVEFEIEGHR